MTENDEFGTTGLVWRTDDETNDAKETSSRGLSPRGFYGNGRRRRGGERAVQDLHQTVQTSLLQKEKRSIHQQLTLKRAAYKQVTTLRTHPLQERALRHHGDLMAVYQPITPDQHQQPQEQEGHEDNQVDEKTNKTSTADNNIKGTPLLTAGGDPSSGSSSSSSSAISSDPEPKRVLRDLLMSPAKSRLKCQYRQEFLQEQAIQGPISTQDAGNVFTASQPLWSMEPRVFSVEKDHQGKRKYVVGQLGRFLDLYWRKTDPHQRHYYEMIRDKTPCRLYFDLEWSKITNPTMDDDTAEELLDELLDELCTELLEKYDLEVDRSSVVDLDSSTDTKFSRHWILHLPGGYLFCHTLSMRRFVERWIGRLAEEQATGVLSERCPLLDQHLFVRPPRPKGGSRPTLEKSCIVDLGVYTRNRLFRLLGSCKFGKPASAVLRIADANQFPLPEGFGNECFYLPAMQEAARRRAANEDGDVDDVDAAVQQFVAATDWTLHARALAETLVVPVNAAKIDFPILPFDENDGQSESQEPNRKNRSHNARRSSSVTTTTGPSPYPCIDGFVVNVLGTRGDVPGSIRSWSISCDDEGTPISISYQMSRNRWCECVGRAHKSNNIYWTVDLLRNQCVQGCHDPECRRLQFRGTPVALPESVQEVLFDEQLARLDEKELLRQQQQLEPPTTETQLQQVDDDEAFETALRSLNLNTPSRPPIDSKDAPTATKIPTVTQLDESPPEQQKLDSPTADRDTVPAIGAAKTSPVRTTTTIAASTRSDNVQDDNSASSDSSDDDLMEYHRMLERRRQERAAAATAKDSVETPVADPSV